MAARRSGLLQPLWRRPAESPAGPLRRTKLKSNCDEILAGIAKRKAGSAVYFGAVRSTRSVAL
jgi:hypothetical protein